MALRAHAARARPNVLSRRARRLLPPLACALSAVCAPAAASHAAGAPDPVGVAGSAFPAALGAFARPDPPLLEVVSDTSHPIRFSEEPPVQTDAVPDRVRGAPLLRLIPQGSLRFALYGEDGARARYLLVADVRRGRVLHALDLDRLAHPPPATPADRELVYAEIVWARLAQGVLYVQNAHLTYAASSMRRNATISAIDLRTGRVLWRSASLVANARTFVLAPGHRIVSGYGFTSEPDFLYVLDRGTGRVLDRLPVRDAPERITRRVNALRVETYTRSLLVRLRR